MSLPFDDNRSDWSVTLGPNEIDRVVQLMGGHPIMSRVPFTWVMATDRPATRRWVRTNGAVFAWLHTEGSDSDPKEPVAIPDGFLIDVGSMAQGLGGAQIFLKEDTNTFVGTSASDYMCIDNIDPDIPQEWASSELFDDLQDNNEGQASAFISGEAITRIGQQFSTETWMRGDPNPNETDVYTTFAIEDGHLRYTHHSASRAAAPLVSGSVTADSMGESTVTFNGTQLWSMVRRCPVAEQVRIVIDGKCPEYVYLFAEDWGVRIAVVPEVTMRWGKTLSQVAESGNFEVTHYPDPWSNHFEFSREDNTVTVQVFEGFAGLDCVRFSKVIATGIDQTMALMTEINAMNETLREGRLIYKDGNVLLLNDVDAPGPVEELSKALASFMWCVNRCEGFGEILPLFAE